MSRGRGVLAAVLQAARAAERERVAAERRRLNELVRAERQQARQAQRDHRSGREHEAESLNADLHHQMERLQSLLTDALSTRSKVDVGVLSRRGFEEQPFAPGGLGSVEPVPLLESYMPPPRLGFSRFLFGAKRRQEEAREIGLRRFGEAVEEHARREAQREAALAQAKLAHEQASETARRGVDDWNAQVDQFVSDYENGAPAAVSEYCRLVLEASDYPECFPKLVRTAFVAESKQLVVEYDLPTIDAIPESAAYKYVKNRDEIVATPRPVGQRRAAYLSVVAQVTLRTLYELFDADTQPIETIVFNGHVSSVDKRTGKPIRPCLVTIRITRATFGELDLAQVEPNTCLKALNASVSPSPQELVPVRPVLEFNMVDPRFVEEMQVLSTIDQRPNLMELSPTEFESLITNLFEKMGLETRQTQASRDGGVDCVAYDPRPIFGGKVVIQAKRYKHTVGVSAVRDLFGTLQNEGGSKGILVTTSGYGKASFEFADGKPLELLSGSHLLFLLKEHAGIEAKIEVPADWKDPVPDSGENFS